MPCAFRTLENGFAEGLAAVCADVFPQGNLGACAFLVQAFDIPIKAPESCFVVCFEGSELLGDERVELPPNFLHCVAEAVALPAARADRLAPVCNVVGAGIRHTFPVATVLDRITEKEGDVLNFRDSWPFISRFSAFEQMEEFALLWAAG